MICPGCTADLPQSEFPTLLKGGLSSKCWRCTNWRLNRAAKECPNCTGPAAEQKRGNRIVMVCTKCSHAYGPIELQIQ